MQATLPPLWSDLERRRRRGRMSLAELGELTARAHHHHLQELRRLRELHARLDWPRVHRPEILLYTPNQLRQLISKYNITMTMPTFPFGAVRLGNAESASAAPGSWRPGPLGAPWHLPDPDPSSAGAAEGGSGGGAGEAGGDWWSWRGWGAGALLLVAALLLVRATDRCFTRNYARSRRRRSEEWPTPNVLATSHPPPPQFVVEAEPIIPELSDVYQSSENSELGVGGDLPPPYCEVAEDKRARREEPPPPYSACYGEGGAAVRFVRAGGEPGVFSDAPLGGRHDPDAVAHSSNGFNADNPVGSRIHKIPYADNTSAETDDDECIAECVADELGRAYSGAAPIASEDMTIALEDDEVSYISLFDLYEEELAAAYRREMGLRRSDDVDESAFGIVDECECRDGDGDELCDTQL